MALGGKKKKTTVPPKKPVSEKDLGGEKWREGAYSG